MRKLVFSLAIAVLGAALFFHRTDATPSTDAYLSWTAPTKNTDGSTLTDLSGYKIYYGTSSVPTGSCPANYPSGNTIDTASTATTATVTGLTPGTTYYFQVTAYNSSGTASACSTSPGQVSKRVTYQGDLNDDGTVDVLDYGILHTDYGTSNSAADVNHDGAVNIFDYNLLHANYGLPNCLS